VMELREGALYGECETKRREEVRVPSGAKKRVLFFTAIMVNP